MINGYDKLTENNGIAMDLPFYEATGAVTRDQAKPHHYDVTLVNTPTWETIASGLCVITFANLTHHYLELASAACVDLDFQGGGYSLGCWFNWQSTATSLNVMGRWATDISGWEVYLFAGGAGQNYLTLRHHHAGTLVGGNPRSACYSTGWTESTWWFMGISRTGGAEAIHYRNGQPVTVVTSGLVDPETCNQDLTMGVRYTKNADYFKGSLWRPRAWNRALTAADWEIIFEKERDWFGV